MQKWCFNISIAINIAMGFLCGITTLLLKLISNSSCAVTKRNIMSEYKQTTNTPLFGDMNTLPLSQRTFVLPINSVSALLTKLPLLDLLFIYWVRVDNKPEKEYLLSSVWE